MISGPAHMKRHQLLIATLAALFAFQAPLCALACLPSAPSEMPMDSSEHAGMPCHDSAPSSTSDVPAERSDECGCDGSLQALIPSADQIAFQLSADDHEPQQAAPLTLSLVATARRNAPPPPSETDLPPPDILLLKTTLLI